MLTSRVAATVERMDKSDYHYLLKYCALLPISRNSFFPAMSSTADMGRGGGELPPITFKHPTIGDTNEVSEADPAVLQ